jgi:hypothetical protein
MDGFWWMMKTFLKLCEGATGKPFVLSWQLVSFLALGEPDQVIAIGSAENWFVKENPTVNPGANYLCGMLMLLSENGGGHHFDDFAPDESQEMATMVEEICSNRSNYQWSVSELREGRTWIRLRQLANTMLLKANLWINAPKEPLWFPDLMEIWWGDYKELDASGMNRSKR